MDKMRNSKTIKEYRIYQSIFKISMVSKTSNEMFKYVTYDENNNATEHVATSYLEYLENTQPIFSSIINDSDVEILSVYISNTITRLETLVDELQYLFIINDSSDNPVYTSLIQLLKFFKSYTVDLSTFNIVYVFDSKYYNMIRLINDINHISKEFSVIDDFKQYYVDSAKVITNISKYDKELSDIDENLNVSVNIKYNDGYRSTGNNILRDKLKITYN